MIREFLGVALFTLAYMLVALGATVITGNQEFLFYVVVMVVLVSAVVLVHSRIGLTRGALWCLSVWGLAHMAGGLVPVPALWPINGEHRVLYSLWLIPNQLKYDHAVHAYGFGVTTWVVWQGLRAAARVERPTIGLLVICAAGGLGFGALNEVIEFAATLVFPHTNVGGYINTGWDLVSNLFGAIAAAVIIRVGHRRRHGSA